MIANSDCPLEEFGSIERVREGILTSLHDAVFFIRFNHHDDVYKKKVKVIIAIKPLIITMTIIKKVLKALIAIKPQVWRRSFTSSKSSSGPSKS